MRAQPLPIEGMNGAATALSSLTGVSLEKCVVNRHNERFPLPPVSMTGRAEWTPKTR